jgi:hypothetical protein
MRLGSNLSEVENSLAVLVCYQKSILHFLNDEIPILYDEKWSKNDGNNFFMIYKSHYGFM